MDPKLLNTVKNVFDRNKNTINPSLYLDKYTGYLEQSDVKEVLREVTNLKSYDTNIRSLINSLKELPGAIIKTFECVTPFTIHLSRTTVLENTGICFHPIYGFVYIPGSGIKGLARAYARDILKLDEKLIIEIFGNENTEKDKKKLRAGKVVFHEAYPVLDDNYKLNVEINNCHHQEYYNGEGKKEPGDWENPIPTYFLSVKQGTKFNFILSLRQDLKEKLEEEIDVEVEENNQKRKLKNKDLVSKAFEILSGALAHMGLGAKTAAGFGTMAEVKNNEYIVPHIPEVLKDYKLDVTLKFTTPAFLAGAMILDNPNLSVEDINRKGEIKKDLLLQYVQKEEDCKILISTLRGQLRWWWRKIYEEKLSNSQLLTLEKLIWGSTENSSPVRIYIKNIENSKIEPIDKIRNKGIECKYISFGISEKNKIEQDIDKKILEDYNINKNVKHDESHFLIKRKYLKEGFKFQIVIICKDSYFKNNNTKKYEKKLDASQVYEQVLFSLWLLTNFGGLGAKSRKGFGSVVCEDELKLRENNREIKIGEDLIKNKSSQLIRNFFSDQNLTINKLFNHTQVTININNNQDPLQKLAKVYLAFAQSKAHDPHKGYLGLPRKFDRPPKDIKISNNLREYERYASPILFHLEPTINSQEWKLNISIFPKNFLDENQPNDKRITNECNDFLSKFIEYIKENINNDNLTIRTYGNRNNNFRRRHP